MNEHLNTQTTKSDEYIGDLGGALARLKVKEQLKEDFTVEAKALRAEPTETGIQIFADAKEISALERNDWTPTPNAHGNFANKLDIPKKYYDRMLEQEPDLLATNINTWLNREPYRRFFMRTYKRNGADVGVLRAFLSDRYKVIDNVTVIDGLYEGLTKNNIEMKINKVHLTDDILRIDLHRPDKTAIVRSLKEDKNQDEEVMSGLFVTNSEVGKSAFSIQPQVIRLVCINGMITENLMREIHLGKTMSAGIIYSDNIREREQKLIKDKLVDAIPQVLGGEHFDNLIAKLEKSRGIEVDDRVGEIKRITSQFSLSDKHCDEIISAFGSYEATNYGVGQAIAQVARDEFNFDRKAELMSIAGEVCLN